MAHHLASTCGAGESAVCLVPKIRGIKLEFWTDEVIVELSIPARPSPYLPTLLSQVLGASGSLAVAS